MLTCIPDEDRKNQELTDLEEAVAQPQIYYTPSFCIDPDWLEVLSLREAVLFGYLAAYQWLWVTTNRTSITPMKWFPVPIKEVKKDLKLSSGNQTRLFNGLIDKGFIKTKRKGLPAQRFVRLLKKRSVY